MTVISSAQDFNEDELYVDLRSVFGQPLFLKCEGFNFAGSVKLKAAAEMVEAAERDGLLETGVGSRRVVVGEPGRGAEHDRGEQGLPVPVRHRLPLQPVDPAADGGVGRQVHIVTEPDPVSGLLGARIDYIRALCAADDRYVWLNQYTNPNAWKAHYRTTAPAIAQRSSRTWTCCSSGPAPPAP